MLSGLLVGLKCGNHYFVIINFCFSRNWSCCWYHKTLGHSRSAFDSTNLGHSTGIAQHKNIQIYIQIWNAGRTGLRDIQIRSSKDSKFSMIFIVFLHF